MKRVEKSKLRQRRLRNLPLEAEKGSGVEVGVGLGVRVMGGVMVEKVLVVLGVGEGGVARSLYTCDNGWEGVMRDEGHVYMIDDGVIGRYFSILYKTQ